MTIQTAVLFHMHRIPANVCTLTVVAVPQIVDQVNCTLAYGSWGGGFLP
jgi:hypothetical protein